jgi:hypothetical protein
MANSQGGPGGDFFGFFGALKKGTFFGSTPKKSPEGGGHGEEGAWKRFPLAALSHSPLAPCKERGQGEACTWSGTGPSGGANKGDFFWVHPKKLPSAPMADKKVPPVPVSLPATLRRKVILKNLLSQLPRTS